MQGANYSSDERLTEMLLKGNRLAFHQVYERYWKRLYNYTSDTLNDSAPTEDCLHDVFSSIWIKKKDLKINNLKSYLYNSLVEAVPSIQ